jgi:ElaB/YqjD/DUF883 family membrane-anchored ribosome-binding protein
MRDDTFATDMHPQAERGLSTAARKVGEGLGELGRALSERRESVTRDASRFIQERPLAAAGLAFGVGYVLAGGLSMRMTGRLLRLGWKLGGMAMVKSFLANASGPAGEGI